MKKLPTRPLEAIKENCRICNGTHSLKAEECLSGDPESSFYCILWPFRHGKNPYSKRRGSNKEHMDKMRQKKTVPA